MPPDVRQRLVFAPEERDVYSLKSLEISLRSARSEMFIAWRLLMANTYSQIYIQTVFSVSNRMSLITPAFREDLYKYITGIVTNQGQKLIAINGMSDHLHILIGLKPTMALADLVRDIKCDSTKSYKQEQVGSWEVQSAGRLRRFFLWAFPAQHDHSLHSEPGNASQPEIFQARVSNPAPKVWHRVWGQVRFRLHWMMFRSYGAKRIFYSHLVL